MKFELLHSAEFDFEEADEPGEGGTLFFSIRWGPCQQFISEPQILSHNFEGPATYFGLLLS